MTPPSTTHLHVALRAVAIVFGVNPEAIVSRNRAESLCVARHAFCVIATEHQTATREEVAAFLGNRHLDTIAHSITTALAMIATNDKFQNRIIRTIDAIDTQKTVCPNCGGNGVL